MPFSRLRRALGAVVCVIALIGSQSAAALSFIRDAEIESLLRRYADPIFQAAGIPPDSVEIFIVNESSLNAFVAGGRNMVFHTGLLYKLETPEELMAVIAHETGHIAGGHVSRRQIAQRRSAGPMILGILLGVAAAAAGSADAAAAAVAGGATVGQRSLLAFSRAEESAADQAALSYLERVGVNPSGLLAVLERMKRQELYASTRLDPYALTHPLSRERITAVTARVNASPLRSRARDPELAYWHERMRAKLDGFLNQPEGVLARWRASGGEAALVARAAAHHRLPDARRALEDVDQLLRLRPRDPYYWELRGQILHESSRPAEAVPAYRQAVALAPDEVLLEVGLAKSLLALSQPASNQEALSVLRRVTRRERLHIEAWRLLSMAEAQLGNNAEAALAAAEWQALRGDLASAKRQARYAQSLFPRGAPGWLRAEDILSLEEPRRRR